MSESPKTLVCAAAILFITSIFCRPVDNLIISAATGPEQVVFSSPVPLNRGFSTCYIHSVQRTPVLDSYRIVNGRIWSWRELVQSHNAGLPFAAPPQGRFYLAPPWMVVEGGRHSWNEIFLRVGDAEFGRNVFGFAAAGPENQIALYEKYPGRRLRIGVERKPLASSLTPLHW